jgi:hypothetical protein
MKKIMSKIALSVFALTVLFSATSCKKDKTYNLNLGITYKVGTEAFAYNQVYTIGGVAVKFTLAQMYLSGIHIEDDDANEGHYDDKYLLIKPSIATYALGELTNKEISHLHEVKFNVGIDSTTNHQTTDMFNARPATDVLSVQNPAMHWSWNSGYIFVKIEGMVDTDADGTPETAAEFHIGMDSYLQAVALTTHKDLEDGDNTISLNFNVAKLFDGVNLATEYVTHTMDNMTLAGKVKANLAAAFSAN